MSAEMQPKTLPPGGVSPVPVARWVSGVARLRVTAGFVVAVAAFWLARPSWLSLAAGVILGVTGEALRFWAAGHLEKAREVTSSGPYRWTRHPLYVGSSLLGAGFAVASRHAGAAVLVAVYLCVSLWAAIRLEEATMRARFGDAYDRYAGGAVPAAARRFSTARAHGNRETHAVLGLAAALALLAGKIVFGV